MNKKLIYAFLALMMVFSVGCSNQAKSEDSEDMSDADDVLDEQNESEEADINENMEYNVEAGLCNLSYLMEKDGQYVYSLQDQDIIEKYDDLYAAAFEDTINSLDEILKWQNQKYDFDKPIAASNLIMRADNSNNIIQTGSYFELDYNFDLNNVGYTYVDLDSDGIFELIMGVRDYCGMDSKEKGYFEKAYTLVDSKPVKIYEGGSRVLFWIGKDGYIYENGSGGAANSGTYKQHFDKTKVETGALNVWGGQGFVIDEYVGFWEVPVHISGLESTQSLDEAAKLPENQITEEELSKLLDELEERQIGIDWMKFSDYVKNHNL